MLDLATFGYMALSWILLSIIILGVRKALVKTKLIAPLEKMTLSQRSELLGVFVLMIAIIPLLLTFSHRLG
jgi:hypothetical protein